MAAKKPKRTLPTDGDKAREARKLAGFTNQHELAEAIGCSYTKIVHIETGQGAEPWLLIEYGKKVGLSLRDLVLNDCRTEIDGRTTKLPGAWKAGFTAGPENSATHDKLLDNIAQELAQIPGLFEFTFKKTNSVIIGLRATINIHAHCVTRMANGWRIAFMHDGRITQALIYAMRFRCLTLEWPAAIETPDFDAPEMNTLRGLIDHFAATDALRVRNHDDGSATIFAIQRKDMPSAILNPISN